MPLKTQHGVDSFKLPITVINARAPFGPLWHTHNGACPAVKRRFGCDYWYLGKGEFLTLDIDFRCLGKRLSTLE